MLDQTGRSEAALAASVVMQALDDLRSSSARERSDAWSFLTAERGGWADSRTAWCSLAEGVDGHVLRERALSGRFGPPPEPQPEQPKPARQLRKQLAPRPPSTAEIEEAVLIAIEDCGLDWKTCKSTDVAQAFEAADVRQWNARPFTSSHIGRILTAERERVGLIKPKPPKPAPRPKPTPPRKPAIRIPAALLASASHVPFASRF